jgi:hypothetical protein
VVLKRGGDPQRRKRDEDGDRRRRGGRERGDGGEGDEEKMEMKMRRGGSVQNKKEFPLDQTTRLRPPLPVLS